MEVPAIVIPWGNRYEDPRYETLEDYMGTDYYGGLDHNFSSYWLTPHYQYPRSYFADTYHTYGHDGAIGPSDLLHQGYQFNYKEHPNIYSSPVSYQDVISVSESSYYGEEMTSNDLSVYYPDSFEGKAACLDSRNYGHPSYQSVYYTNYSHNDKRFYPGHNRLFGNQSPVLRRRPGHYEAYPSSYHSSPANPDRSHLYWNFVDGYFGNFHWKKCDYRGHIQDNYLRTNLSQSRVLPVGIEDSRYYRAFNNSFAAAKPPCKKNVIPYNRGLSSKRNTFRGKHAYNNFYKTTPAKT